ncbi:Lrp/AsnC family transcriptional regulator [Jiangella muralis]|uniref:Lrp/AsnC family transcriptional regulator n=1 Tax=Jiangella muralis TaxID=702383 RepID=UPI00069D64B6|nr:Lrp/AsnC ligand binding domain-containing protein [Jiangella muralis]
MDTLDDDDLALLHAVQLAPRAPWQRLGPVLGADPVTVARRWARLSGSGAAWFALHPALDGLTFAFVEVSCGGSQADVVAALVRDPRVVTLEHVTGDRDLLLTVLVPELPDLAEFLLTGLPAVPGVRAVRTTVGIRSFLSGSRWRLRALSPSQQVRLAALGGSGAVGDGAGGGGGGPARGSAEYRALLRLLSADARLGATEVASRLGVSRVTARRRLAAAFSGDLVVRCDVAQPLTGWPVTAMLWAQVPPGHVDDVARRLAGLPEARAAESVTGGAANLLLGVWLRSLADLQRLEAALAERVPELRVLDRSIALRTAKRMGHLLDASGRAVGHVPVDPWATPAS